MTVVSDTSPIVKLAAVGQLDLLRELYAVLLIPPAVYHEIVVVGAGLPGADEVRTQAWFQQHAVATTPLLLSLRSRLDPGEAEAVALAEQLSADLTLLDDRKARREAAGRQLHVIGLLGVLLEAKRTGLLQEIRPVMDDLIVRAGFWIGAPLYASILKAAGE